MQETRAVIFDLDGTLADTTEAVLHQLGTLSREFGHPADNEAIIEMIHVSGGSIHRILQLMLGDLEAAALQRVTARHSQLIVETRHLMKPYVGALSLLEELPGLGYGQAVFTARTKEMLHDAASEVLLPYFDVIISLEHVAQPKPHPEGVLAAAAALNVQPHQTIMVGDTAADILAGNAAGARTIGLTHGYGTRQSLIEAGADHIVDDLQGVLPYIRQTKGV